MNGGELWIEDTCGKFAEFDLTQENEGLKQRQKTIAESKSFELCGRLHLDVFLQEKYLPNGMEIRLRLNRTHPNFCMIGGTNAPAIQHAFEVVCLNVRHVSLMPSVAMDLNQVIAQSNMKIPIRRVEVKTFTITAGLRSATEDHLFQGQLPKRIFIGMVDNKAFNGTYRMNPFHFQHFDLSKLDVSCNGHSIYNRPFEPNFEQKLYLRSYMSLYQAVASLGQNKSFGLNMDDYAGGNCLWGYDLTPDQGSEEGQLHPLKTGNLRVELQFATALPTVINVIVYAEFDNQIVVNSLREAITDY